MTGWNLTPVAEVKDGGHTGVCLFAQALKKCCKMSFSLLSYCLLLCNNNFFNFTRSVLFLGRKTLWSSCFIVPYSYINYIWPKQM